jgi:hypothetical protein
LSWGGVVARGAGPISRVWGFAAPGLRGGGVLCGLVEYVDVVVGRGGPPARLSSGPPSRLYFGVLWGPGPCVRGCAPRRHRR